MNGKARALSLYALLALGACATADPEVGNPGIPAVDAGFTDLEGARYEPMKPEGVASVMIFVTVDCPISNTYAPEIQSIVRDFEGEPVEFYLVHVDPSVTVEAARSHADDFSLSCTILMDPTQKLVKTVGATVTPEAAVISKDGTLVYRGRIDNLYGDLGSKRPLGATRHELRDAITAVLAGEPVSVERTEAVGCYIPEIF